MSPPLFTDSGHEPYESDSSQPIRRNMRPSRIGASSSMPCLRSSTAASNIYYNCIRCGTLTNSSWHDSPDHPNTFCVECAKNMADKYKYVEQTPRRRLKRKFELKEDRDGLVKEDTAEDTVDTYMPTYTPERLRLKVNEPDTGSLIVVAGVEDLEVARPQEKVDDAIVPDQPPAKKRQLKEEARKRIENEAGAEFVGKLKHIENAGHNVWRSVRQLVLLKEADKLSPDEILKALIKAEHEAHINRSADPNKITKAQLNMAAVDKAMKWIKNGDRSFLEYRADTAAIQAKGWCLDAAGFIVDPGSEYVSTCRVAETALPSAEHNSTELVAYARAAMDPTWDRQRLGVAAEAEAARGFIGSTPNTTEHEAAKFYSFTRAGNGQTWNRATVEATGRSETASGSAGNASSTTGHGVGKLDHLNRETNMLTWDQRNPQGLEDAAAGAETARGFSGMRTGQPAPNVPSHPRRPQVVGHRQVAPDVPLPDHSKALILPTKAENTVNSLDDLKKLQRLHHEAMAHQQIQAGLVANISRAVEQAMKDREQESARCETLQEEVRQLREANQTLTKRSADLELSLDKERKKFKKFRGRLSLLMDDSEDIAE